MVSKEDFIKLLKGQIQQMYRIDQINSLLGPSLIDLDVINYGDTLFNNIMNILFDEEGVDTIDWWLYEKNFRSDYKMWDKDGNEIPTETTDDLWEIIKNNRK